jgi:peptidoglycan/xylan/chitin deacetylase (PgdA/CDA1 family)
VFDAGIHCARIRARPVLVSLLAIAAAASATVALGTWSTGSASARPTPLPAASGAEARGEAHAEQRRAWARGRERATVSQTAGAVVTRRTPVPILMYHVIAQAPDDAPYPDLYVTPSRFAAHIAYLARHGYHGVTLQQVWDHWHGGPRLPSKPVVVSFDDGSRDWYTHAYPTLRRHGWVGTMNLASSHLNRFGIRARWVRRLIAAGWELDSHTLTHPDLSRLGGRDLRREVAGSRARLRRLFGVPVNFFCYPSGRYDARVIAEVRRAGYLGATTTVAGYAVPTTPFTLTRVRINGSDGAADLGAKLARSR